MGRQVTRLRCGGVALAVLMHHFVAYGAAQSHFVASWAELARRAAMAAPPHLDRSRMKVRTPPCPSFEHKEFLVHKQTPSFASDVTADLPPTTSRIFEFLPEDMTVLKEHANAEPGGVPFTGFQALAGHTWKHVIKPPLPATYFENVALLRMGPCHVLRSARGSMHSA